MNKRDCCSKCGASKDTRSKQCKACRKIQQQSTKPLTLSKRRGYIYDTCHCGAEKAKTSKQCRKCAIKRPNAVKIKALWYDKCPSCDNLKSTKAKICKDCFDRSVSPVRDGHIFCRICKTNKPLQDFYKKARGYCSECKPCSLIRSRIGHIKRKLTKYGVDQNIINTILKSDHVDCSICGIDISGKFHIDHCHKRGKFRGLLCAHCNTGLGLFKESQTNLLKAVEYLNLRFDSN